MAVKLLKSGYCGCLWLFPVETEVLTGAYINQESSYDPLANDYIPYISEVTNNYYVPEDYDEMSDPRKHSEDAEAPSLNAMSLFVGIQDNGNGTFTNYNFTPQQLASYVMGQSIFNVEADGGDTVTDARFTRPVILINDGQQSYNQNSFTQVGTVLTFTNGNTYEAGHILTPTLA